MYSQREKQAEQLASEISRQTSHRLHDQLDSGQSEEEKFSSVKRSGSSSNSNRYPNSALRGRGRSRGSGPPVNYRDSANEHITNTDGKYNRHPASNTDKRMPGLGM